MFTLYQLYFIFSIIGHYRTFIRGFLSQKCTFVYILYALINFPPVLTSIISGS